MQNTLKQKIGNRQITIGSWLQLPDVFAAEVMARAGFDWLAIDLEHGLIDLQKCFELIQAVGSAGTMPLVRLNMNDASTIRRVMDAGAGGVIVPMVNTAGEAKAAVEAIKYAPAGKRSYGLGRAQEYGDKFESYIKNINDQSLLIIQIEHVDAVANLDDILRVPGIDAVIIGPYDLSGSLDRPGDFKGPEFAALLGQIMEKVKRSKIALGMHIVHPSKADFDQRIAEGFTFIAYGMDTIFLSSGAQAALKGVRK